MEYRITCRVVDTTGVLLRVGIGNEMYSVNQIHDWIINRIHNFYTYENGKRVEVKARTSVKGRKFITTDPDDIKENNLDELPSC